ncbi:undecaprenyl/decaprenyl-phosphate alpha-N-acetylglucosaminyl 1-phosphate transferase [bacterium]|nr:undecaprenyl/decaprenyl-phosphate alpha-N-acetylglucosaminyl 1-phosphate transferase [bacterium]
MEYIAPFLVAFIISLLVTPLVKKVMVKKQVMNHPSTQRWSNRTVPLMGGIAIFAGFFVSTVIFSDLGFQISIVLIGASIIFISGVIDDLYGMNAKIKFSIQFILGITTVMCGVVFFITPFLWLNRFITLLWIVGLTNSLNLLDNMDGLSAGIASIAGFGLFSIAIISEQYLMAVFTIAFVGGCLGFLKYNFKPAQIFMGDCGSQFMGYSLATLAVIAQPESISRIISFAAPVMALGVAIFDTSLVTIQRLLNGRKFWSGGKDHSSHRLAIYYKGNEVKAVLLLYLFGILTSATAVVSMKMQSIILSIVLVVLLGLFFTITGILLSRVQCYFNLSTEE